MSRKTASLLSSLCILSACGEGTLAVDEAGEAVEAPFPDAHIEMRLEAFFGVPGEVRQGLIEVDGEEVFRSYSVIRGHRVVEGDILVGREDGYSPTLPEPGDLGLEPPPDIEADELSDELAGMDAELLAVSGKRNRWPNGVIRFFVHRNLRNPERVWDAMRHLRRHTPLRFRRVRDPRTQDFVVFEPGEGCASHVGRLGGMQSIWLAGGCSTAAVVHEIGHAAGAQHEHTRNDRNYHIQIYWDNITDGSEDNFYANRGNVVGRYDVHSIMHYGSFAFSKNGRRTIRKYAGDGIIDGATRLSERDKAAFRQLY